MNDDLKGAVKISTFLWENPGLTWLNSSVIIGFAVGMINQSVAAGLLTFGIGLAIMALASVARHLEV